MQIVIDIDEQIITDLRNGYARLSEIADAVKNGTVLPKCHGRLIDADSLLDRIVDYGEGQHRLMLIDPYYVRNADAIIEADKETENE